ncbi:MAG: UmuC protein [Bacteroidota bacterium]|jgi:DNA polymerase V
MFALIDCNNFYASCERVFRPDLNGKPVVILSNNDGCVIARSNEAKAIGVPMGAPAYQFENMFKLHHVHVFSANFALYGDMSMRVMNILSTYCPDVEVYSIDEAFLHFTGFEKFDLQTYCEEMSRKVHKSTGIPVSIGLAPTKALSKLANRIAKKYPKETKGVYIIDSEEKRLKALKWLKVEDIWGIGRQYAKLLNTYNINTALDFVKLPDDFVKSKLSVVELRLKHELEGKQTLSLEEKKAKKNISTTRSFEKTYSTFEELRERIVTFSVSCAEKLRRQNSCCNSIMVFIRTNNFRKEQPQNNKNIVVKLPFSTNSSIEIAQYATKGLSQIFEEGYGYKKAGVIIMDFCKETEIQQNIFENSNPKHKALMKAMDVLNSSLGQQKIKLATQDKDRIWKMKQEKLSPRYTTKLSEIITVNASDKI